MDRDPRVGWISVMTRCKIVLMIMGKYAYGDHVVDPRAFVLRCQKIMSDRTMFPLILKEDPVELR